MIDLFKVGYKISQYRKKLNLSQEELSEKLHYTKEEIAKMENGIIAPTIDNIFELCKMFNTNFDDLLCLDEMRVDDACFFTTFGREKAVNNIVSGKIKVNLPEIFSEFTYRERRRLLNKLKDKKLYCDLTQLASNLTEEEKKYLFGEI